MRKIGYSVKAILKHRVSLVVFCILLIFNLFSMVELVRENLLYTDQQQLLDYKISLYSDESAVKSQMNIDLQKEYDETQKANLENYYCRQLWFLDLWKNEVVMLENGEDITRTELINDLLFELTYMDYIVDRAAGSDFAETIFANEIEKYEDELKFSELPFDTQTLYLMPYVNETLTRNEKLGAYTTSLKTVEYYFYLLDHNLSGIELASVSSWSFLVNQIGMGSLLSYLVFPLAIVYAAVYLYDSRQKQSLKLLMTQGMERKQIIFNQGLALVISFLLLFSMSLLLPMLVLFFIDGGEGINLPILVNMQGLKSMALLEHTDSYGVFQLSTYPAPYLISTQPGYYVFPSTMEFMPLWQVLILTASLSILKISVAISLGTMSIFCLRKRWQSFGSLAVFLFAYLYFQNQVQNVYSRLNIFDIRSSLATLQGCYQTTFLNAIVLCLASIVVINGLNIVLFKRLDYSE